MQKPVSLLHFICGAALISSACASVQVAPPAPVVAPITWEQKLAWMARLEDQRLIREPNPPAPVVIRAATRTEPAIVAPPAPSDLLRLIEDPEARVRRRAALALGRVGLTDAVGPLVERLSDEEPEVRQMAAFALGLLADPSARPALVTALSDASPIVQGRAAQALGAIGDRGDATAVADMTRAHITAGALAGIEPDDLTYPLAPGVEAIRLGFYALARLGSYEALASVVLGPDGTPVTRWWPAAYALQRVNDSRAVPALLALITTPGRYTAAFAIRGLGAAKAAAAAVPLQAIVEQRTAAPAVIIQALRALAAIGGNAAITPSLAPALLRILDDPDASNLLRAEALGALAAVPNDETADILLDLLSDRSPLVRAGALRALARTDVDRFMLVLSGLDADRDWTVRVALATALGGVPIEQSMPRLLLLLRDPDPRVVPAAITALARAGAQASSQLNSQPGAATAANPATADVESVIVEQLKANDFAARAAAATALADLRATAAVPALVAMFHAAIGDSTYVARGAALAAMARLNPAAARPVLQEALRDRDWALRVRAAALLRDQGVTDGIAASIRPATMGVPVDDPAWRAMLSPRFSPHAFIETARGTIEIELAVLDAPLTVNNFMTLARKGFFNGLQVHRVVPDFVVQDGDPRGDGEGGPGYTIRDEINERPYLRGTVGMALDWQDTGGSQFFMTLSPQPHLDGRYTVFGTVVHGMEVVDRIVPGDVITRIRIWDGVTNAN